MRINDHRGLRPAHLPRRDRQVERRRRDPRGAAPGPRELQPLHARRSASARPPASSCPASRAGLLRPPSRWSALSLASLSFGQEIGVTALQMTTAVGAVANGGYLMKPLPGAAVEDAAGRVVKSYKPVAVRRVLEPRTVDVLTDLLKGVVRNGTGRRRAVPGLHGGGQDRHRAEDRRHRPLLDDRPRGLVRRLRARLPARAGRSWSRSTPRGARATRAATWPRRSSRASPSTRCATWRSRPTTRSACCGPRSAAPCPPRLPPTSPRPPAAAAAEAEPGRDARPARPPAREAAIAAARRGLIVELRGSGRVVDADPGARHGD